MPNIRIKRYTGAAWEELDIQSDWTQILNKPSTFTPTAHTHPVGDLTASGSPSSATFLRGDGTWATISASTSLGSGSDFINGTFVSTDLDAAASSGPSWTIEVIGKGYGIGPIMFVAEGYNYDNTFINLSGYNYGVASLDYMIVFNNFGTLAFWWPRLSYWNSFDVRVTDTSASGVRQNRVTGFSDAFIPNPSIFPKQAQINFIQNVRAELNGEVNVRGNIKLTGSVTTTNQARTIEFTGFDKEGTNDFSDNAFIRHTTNTAGHSGSVLVLSSQNDADDGIAFETNAASALKHNGHTIVDAGVSGFSNWGNAGTVNAVVGQLAWRNYGNSHTIFDASSETAPNGAGKNRTNAEIPWVAGYPSLMGWNGTNTFGVRVDRARQADYLLGSWDTSSRNYLREWIEMPNHTGLYSPINNAHFYPNNLIYGAWRVTGTRNGWGGLEFDTAANGNISLMIGQSATSTGFHNNAYGWQLQWESGSGYISKNSYGGGTLARLWDNSNLTFSLVNGNELWIAT